MIKHKGITLTETLVVLFVLIFIFMALFFNSIFFFRKPPPPRIWCNSNLKGLGTAMIVYARDYNDRYPQLPGTGPWSKELGFPYDMLEPDFSPGGEQADTPRTVTASWYLLVRYADVGPKSLICPQTRRKEFDWEYKLDLVELWDFGPTPHKHVSYALHNPYGRFPASSHNPASFAVAADMNPWFKDGDIQPPGPKNKSPQVITLADPTTWPLGMSRLHAARDPKKEFGQNVLYADGHAMYELQPNTGVNNDNIYTVWSTDENPTDQDKQGGAAPTGRTPETDAKSEEDSFLVI